MMRARRLVRAGLSVSQLAFGGGRVGGIPIHGSARALRPEFRPEFRTRAAGAGESPPANPRPIRRILGTPSEL